MLVCLFCLYLKEYSADIEMHDLGARAESAKFQSTQWVLKLIVSVCSNLQLLRSSFNKCLSHDTIARTPFFEAWQATPGGLGTWSWRQRHAFRVTTPKLHLSDDHDDQRLPAQRYVASFRKTSCHVLVSRLFLLLISSLCCLSTSSPEDLCYVFQSGAPRHCIQGEII